MIPRVLEIKNFLSYGDTPVHIDFKDYNLICLSGKNGNGKSALLDALTWAIWGQARKIAGNSKPDEGLVRLGQSRMMVNLEFDCGNGRYRVRREFTKSYGKPLAALDFEVFDNVENKYVSLTDKTIRATQAKIEEVVGLDFDTFTNSAFLRQGQSNEFSKKSAKERKVILGSILGLERYDKLQEKAHAKARLLNDEKKTLTASVEKNSLLIGHKETSLTSLETVKKASMDAQAKKASINATIQQVQQQNTSLMVAYEKAQAEIDDLHKKKDSLQIIYNNIASHRAEWKKIHKLSLQRESIDELSKQKQALLSRQAEELKLQQEHLDLQQQINSLNKTLLVLQHEHENTFQLRISDEDKKINKLTVTLESAKAQAESLKKQIQQLVTEQETLKKKETELNQNSSQIDMLELEVGSLKKQFEKRRAAYQAFVQRGNWAKNELIELEHKQKIVHDSENPACPLCEQLLTAKRKQFIAMNLITHEAFLQHRIARISKVLLELKKILVSQHAHLQEKEVLLLTHKNKKIIAQELVVQQQKITEKYAELIKQHTLLCEQIAPQEALLQKITTAKQLLDQDKQRGPVSEEYMVAKKAIATLTLKLGAQTQAKASALEIAKNIEQIDQKIQQHNQIEALVVQQHNFRLKIRQACLDGKKLKNELNLLPNKLADLAKITTELQNSRLTNEKLALEMAELSSIIENNSKEEGRLSQILETIQAAERENTTLLEAIKKLDTDSEAYAQLAVAFGKNGIQALLIEDAIPEIEHEANKLLSKLTNNQSQIFIESVRDLKSGGFKETLDIHIADAAGMRPYEMYSGGEAFRVDFSLRVAIAKLLARRAGRSLQILIIDEGFGSQDEEGLNNIMDALYAIQNDFARIIIVSHLQELKHNFPVHFTVEKTIVGSLVQVEERG